MIYLPGALLLLFAAGHYGDVLLSDATGWGIEWAYGILQAAMQAGLWLVIAIAYRRHRARVQIIAVCVSGMIEGLLRDGCSVWQMLAPVEIRPDQNLCEAITGMPLYTWGLVQLAALAVLIAGWANNNRGRYG